MNEKELEEAKSKVMVRKLRLTKSINPEQYRLQTESLKDARDKLQAIWDGINHWKELFYAKKLTEDDATEWFNLYYGWLDSKIKDFDARIATRDILIEEMTKSREDKC